MSSSRIKRIDFGVLEGQRPRGAGSNARIGEHGLTVRVPLVRLTTSDGVTGFGRCRASQEQLQPLVGSQMTDAFDPKTGPAAAWRAYDFPLWDLAAKIAHQPVYALAATIVGTSATEPFAVPCYDTSLYFDDLEIEDDSEAAELIAGEAREGYERGHRAFKIKVGRGGRHMPLEEGTRRDIVVVHAVRAAVGDESKVMLDANNGYNLNLTKRVLAETATANIHWMEEPFHEDIALYEDLREWLQAQGLTVLIADGEGLASSALLDWARAGAIDVVQYDIFSHGFSGWLETGRQLDAWGVQTAPHHYGGHYGNYAAPHLAAAVKNFAFAEWDEVTTPGIEAPDYVVQEGQVHIPPSPGFGLELDEARFARAVETGGFSLE